MKKSGYLIFLVFLSISLVSASISINQPFEKYNYGDFIYVNIDLNPTTVSGNFEINLVCENGSANVYKISPAESSFSANKDQKVSHKIVLTKEFIGDIGGECYVSSSIGQESISTNKFSLTNEIELDVKLDKSSYLPGEKIVWNVQAKKANSNPLNGFVDIHGINDFSKQVVNGLATDSIAIIENTPAGKYELIFFAYDKDSSEILNQRKITASYQVEQVAKSVSLNILSFDAIPGKDYEFAADIFDQTGNKMSGVVSASYYSSSQEKKFFDLNSSNTGKINIPQNQLPGKYYLTVTYKNLPPQTKEFNVLPNANVSIEFLQNKMIIKNVGNVPYVKNVSVFINGEVRTIDVDLALGEKQDYVITTNVSGDHIVEVSDDVGQISKNTVSLIPSTGAVIDIREWNGINLLQKYSFIWIFIVVIFILAAVVILIKYYRKKTFKFGERIKLDKKEDITVVSAKAKMKKDFVDLGKPEVQEAQSSLATSGNKNSASVVAISVKNIGSLGNDARNQLNSILNEAKGDFGVLEWKMSHAIIIVSPLITKTYKNEIIAAKIAWKIKQKLDEYNKKFSNKINYNIGIHTGEMISSLNAGKLNYTSLGNTMILTKRISDLSDAKLLISGAFRLKLMRELKVNPFTHSLGDLKVFEVTRIADVEANHEKLKDLLKRTGFD